MLKCPVCGCESSTAAICPQCGYDPSCDYIRHPTAAQIPKSAMKLQSLQAVDSTKGKGNTPVKPVNRPGAYDRTGFVLVTPQEASSGIYKCASFDDGSEGVFLVVPPNTAEGTKLRVPGSGKQNPSTGAKGDALIEVRFSQDRQESQDSGKNIKNSTESKEIKKSKGSGTQSGKQKIEQPYDDCIIISSAEAQRGRRTTVSLSNGEKRIIAIPAGCKDGTIIDRIKIVIYNRSLHPGDISKLADVQLLAYMQGKGTGHFWSWLMWSLIVYTNVAKLFLPSRKLEPIMLLSFALLLVLCYRIYVSAKINSNARSATAEYFRRHPKR